jgi:NADPH:quinone reductase-like Zn-dependent oxidoreductase
VGTFAVQLARAAGARVVAVARAWARDLLRGLGAEAYTDIDRAPLGDVDLIFDLVGGETLRRSCAAVKPGGGVVSVVERPLVASGRRGWFFVVEPSRPQLLELGQRIAAGELHPVVGASWPLRDGRAAFEAKQRGGKEGKAVLLLTDER